MLEKAIYFGLGILVTLFIALIPALLWAERGDTAPAEFIDVPADHTQNRFIGIIGAAGLMVGDGTGNFYPERPMTRCEAAVVMVKLMGEEALHETGDWCSDWLLRAIELGAMPIIDAEEAASTPVTRGDVATLVALAKAAK